MHSFTTGFKIFSKVSSVCIIIIMNHEYDSMIHIHIGFGRAFHHSNNVFFSARIQNNDDRMFAEYSDKRDTQCEQHEQMCVDPWRKSTVDNWQWWWTEKNIFFISFFRTIVTYTLNNFFDSFDPCQYFFIFECFFFGFSFKWDWTQYTWISLVFRSVSLYSCFQYII